MENASSEQELLELRRDGKISEDEYKQLLGAMKTSPIKKVKKTEPIKAKVKSKRKLGLIAFFLMLAGVILPVIFFLGTILIIRIVGPENLSRTCFIWIIRTVDPGYSYHYFVAPWIILGVILEITAFVMGIIAWPDAFGKATVITTSILFVLMILSIPMFFTIVNVPVQP